MTESFRKGPLAPAALNHQTWKTFVLLPFFSFPTEGRVTLPPQGENTALLESCPSPGGN